jgi:hypothetical protein
MKFRIANKRRTTEKPNRIQKKTMSKQKAVAGPLSQIRILLWKNFILFRRNKLSTFIEILAAYIFVGIMALFRFFIDSTHYPKLDGALNPEVGIPYWINTTSNRSIIAYYPPNSFIGEFVLNSIFLILRARPDFSNISGECLIICQIRLILNVRNKLGELNFIEFIN